MKHRKHTMNVLNKSSNHGKKHNFNQLMVTAALCSQIDFAELETQCRDFILSLLMPMWHTILAILTSGASCKTAMHCCKACIGCSTGCMVT